MFVEVGNLLQAKATHHELSCFGEFPDLQEPSDPYLYLFGQVVYLRLLYVLVCEKLTIIFTAYAQTYI